MAGVAPATRPNGITPTSIGATALAPASSSARAVGVGTGASCRESSRSPPGLAAVRLPSCCRSLPPSTSRRRSRVLRGWMHLVCFFLAIPAGVTVIALAHSLPRPSGCARVRARPGRAVRRERRRTTGSTGRPTRRLWMQKLDHGTIFVMIAGSYTPVCLLVLRGWVAWTMLAIAWTGAVARVRARLHRRPREPDHAQRALLLPRLGVGGRPSRRCGPTCPSSSSC